MRIDPKALFVYSNSEEPYGQDNMTTPNMQTPKLTSSYLQITSPKNKKAIIAANMGEVLFKNDTFESEISLIAMLNIKKVIVPEIALIITSLH